MGAQNADKYGRNYDPEAGVHEAPPHQVTLKAFRLARFPTTVNEFIRFVDSGGYETKRHWRTAFRRVPAANGLGRPARESRLASGRCQLV
jgi:formylglycine-generating enzyme required for sulfatase activity